MRLLLCNVDVLRVSRSASVQTPLISISIYKSDECYRNACGGGGMWTERLAG